jgi:methionine aminopeptidase
MIVLRYETHTHSKTYRFNELTELIKFDNFGDKMFRLKQMMVVYEQAMLTDEAKNTKKASTKKMSAKAAKAAKENKKGRTFSPAKFLSWLGSHWASVSKMPGVKQAGVTHFLQLHGLRYQLVACVFRSMSRAYPNPAKRKPPS